MNNVSLTGRLTREPELRYGGQDNSTAITRFTLAVDDGKDTDTRASARAARYITQRLWQIA